MELLQNIPKKIQKIAIVVVVGLSLVSYFPQQVYADSTDGVAREVKGSCSGRVMGIFPQWSNGLPCDSDGTPIPTSLNQLWIIAINILENIMVATGFAATGFFVWGGFTYIRSQGDPSKVTEAKNTLLNSVIGLIIVLSAVAILNFAKGALGAS